MVATPAMGAVPAQNATTAKTAPKSRMNGTVPTVQPPTIPYSARRCAPLDMNTVERKGHPSTRDPPFRNRHFDLKEAPTYRPTEEQWKDPFEYVKSIYEEASKYGICKIDPPESWNPDFAIDLSRFHFRTRRQELNSVEGGTRANLNYLDTLAKFHQQYGTSLNRFPSVDKRPLDLYKLKKAVEVRGGFEKVCKDKKWAEIGRDLGYSGKIMSSLSTSLKNSYQRWLHPYEEYLRTAKPGVQQQLEQENGGPYMASPAYSPPKVTYSQHSTPASMMNHSPAIQASAALNASFAPQDIPILPAPVPGPPAPSPPPAPALQSGFTAVNSGGFAAVNAPSSFVAVNHAPPQPIAKVEAENGSTLPTHNGQYSIIPPGMPSSAPYNFEPPPSMSLTNGAALGSNPMKRTMSHDSFNGDSGSEGLHGDDDSASGRRSKRVRRDGQQSNGESLTSSMMPSITRMRSKSATRRTGEKCEHCGSIEDKDNILVCESCELGFHRWCLDPPLQAWPDYDWHCPKCLVGTGEYGFEEGGIYSLKHFQEKANNFKEFHFQSRMPFDPVTNQRRQPSEDDIEREFWRLVETINETVEVEYGADIHSTTHGSGFPTIEKNPLNKYSKDLWNLNILPFHEESLFRHIKTDISGMTVPWLYVGMCFSTFCWHNEDHYTYSANYQHFGATKTWYGIPGKDAQRFEEAMRKAVPELFEQQPDLLFQLVTLLPPNQLRQAGVDVYALDQRAGQFVITFPQAYHAGFNHGFNFNEAVNFAPSDWEPFGETGTERLQEFRKQPCFSHDELLLTAAAVDSTIKTAKWLAPALERMRDRELHLREQLLKRHQELLPHDNCFWNADYVASEGETPCKLKHIVEDVDLTEDEVQCFHCKAYTFLTQFRCQHTGKVSCLLHTEITDCCAETPQERLLGPNHLLRYRHNNEDLRSLAQKVVDKAAVPEAWQAKLNNLLEDEPRPPLKSLHSLLAEGEKIPYTLPGLDDLANFVRNCDRWVEEANLYLTRKQTNRRKNEKAWRRQSTKGTKLEEKEVEPELTIERMVALIDEGETLGFQCAQLENLSEKVTNVNEWRNEAQNILLNPVAATAEQIEGLIETGRSFMAAMPELTDLEALHEKQKWLEDAQRARSDMQTLSLEGCKAMLKRAQELNFPPEDHQFAFFTDMARQGDFWEVKAKEVMSAETMHYPQLESLHAQTQTHAFPVNPETLAQMDAILTKNREAHRQIVKLYEQSRDPDFRKRPLYTNIREIMKTLEDLNSKPQGTIDLERELRRHEDWMRKGKKLFGKANAPLHILEQHMKFVEDRNNFCFDLNDTFRPPVEPASREASPTDDVEKGVLGEDEKPVFCICRQNEGGMMIMCEVCREWYHSKCLKIARGKMKEVDDFTCPICDWRVKIPRDAARPKLEELIGWKEEMPNLPFQPEEEDILSRIIDKAQAFRDFMQQFTNANQICRGQEEMSSMLFYLRKLEGAEVLLSHETNIFRQECYNYNPIAPQAPPILDQSLSTRKPRPTKQQKLLKEHGVEKVEDLPEHLRAKAIIKRKNTSGVPKAPLIQPAGLQRGDSGPAQGQARSNTPLGMPRLASTGNAPVNGQNGNHLPMSMAQSSHFTQTFATAGASSYPSGTPSPMFSPTISMPTNGLRDPAIASHFSGPSALGQGPTTHHDSYPLFTPGFSIDADDDIRVGLANANGSTVERDEPETMSSPHANHEDDMFNMMTRSSPERGDQDTQNEDPPPLDEQATEALEMIRKASEESREASRGGDGAADEEVADDENPEKAAFEDFF